MLSNEDIKKELGKNILIFPFEKKMIRGASLNLSASNCAWSLKTKQSIVDGNKIKIEPHDTALIETKESIWVSNKIAGTYHSKVSLVSKGLSHIGTTLDPEWIGSSLVAITNNNEEPFFLECGESFVSICFYYLRNKSEFPDNQNNPGRTNLLLDLQIQTTDSDKAFLSEEWRTNKDTLKAKLCESESYKQLKKNSNQWKRYIPLIIVVFVELGLFLGRNKINFKFGGMEPWEAILFIGLSGFIVLLLNFKKNK